MTREEAKRILNAYMWKGELDEARKMAIKALEQVPKLQNRCYVLTHGYLCGFCPYECEHKAESDTNGKMD